VRTTVALVGAVAVFAAGVAVGSGGAPPDDRPGGDGGSTASTGPVSLPQGLELAGALSAFPGCDEYLAHVTEHALEQVTPYGLGGGMHRLGLVAEMADDEQSAGEAAAGGDRAVADTGSFATPSPGTTPDDVSGTNVQEAGVDEPDRVKTDGEVLYVATGDRIRIVDIAGDTPEELGEVRLHEGGWGAELLLAGDRLLVTSGQGGFVPFAGERVAADGLWPGPGGSSTTLTVVDVADPARPQVEERLVLDGATLSARMVDGVARVVIRTEAGVNLPWEHPEASGLRAERRALAANEELIRSSVAEDWLPYYVHETADGERSEGTLVACQRVAQPETFSGLGLLSVLTVDVAAGSLVPGREGVAVLAGGDTVYASTERLYVATQRWRGDVRSGGGGIWTTAEPADDVEVQRRFPDRDDPAEPEVTTELHAFAIDDPRTTGYLGSGAVDGTLLSQWALSDHEGVLRVASTVGDPWSASSSSSSVTTLGLEDGELVELGRVDGLGPTETIHAVRFLGEVGYVVTFRQTDPLYTVDLSDPTDPEVVGELKIPGYSAYLHPVGEGQLLGVGQEADEQGATEGVQVSLFDVSDPADPRRTDTVTVPRSSSTVEWDHRAFLHWPATGLTVVPVTRYDWREPGEEPVRGPLAGALALVPDGDRLRAAADHDPEDLVLHHADARGDGGAGGAADTSWPGDHAGAIVRALVTGDRLVTVSERGVIVHDLATLADRGTLGF
jgi:hypothetical protein